ncbi:MAG: hypothetical protein NZ551_07520 [Microscillaceae bacterium]|nr:hypothetical protein [Microscillaceae bacterium]MDW8461044.1 hypothetical protein [Cytophagales bacterium]
MNTETKITEVNNAKEHILHSNYYNSFFVVYTPSGVLKIQDEDLNALLYHVVQLFIKQEGRV